MIAEFLAERVLAACRAQNLRLVTVESCTSGLIAAALTDIPGASDVVECGFITYANAAKMRLVGVPEALLAQHGAVSRAVAEAMAAGGLRQSGADIAISVTGIAGPGGGTAAKPVGLVHMAAALKKKDGSGPDILHYEARFGDIGREKVRQAAVHKALELILQKIEG